MIADLFNHEGGAEEEEIPVISLWQPWAQWILWGWKTIETRLHPRFASLAGKNVGIHASVTWDKKAITIARRWLSDEQVARTYDELRRGGCPGSLIAIASISEHRLTNPSDAARALIECETPRYGLVITRAVAIDPPYRCKGQRGIWRMRVPK
jgi:hypothetical protein